MTPELDVRVLLAALLISTITGLAFGLAPGPAAVAHRARPVAARRRAGEVQTGAG